MHIDGTAPTFNSTVLQKSVFLATWMEYFHKSGYYWITVQYIFAHWCRSRKFLVVRNIFHPNFPKIARRTFMWQTFPLHIFCGWWLLINCNCHILNHKVARNSLLILYTAYLMCFLWHNKLLVIRSITKKYNFINTVKKCRNFCARIFKDFSQMFDKLNLLGVCFHPWIPSPYTTIFACEILSKIPYTSHQGYDERVSTRAVVARSAREEREKALAVEPEPELRWMNL